MRKEETCSLTLLKMIHFTISSNVPARSWGLPSTCTPHHHHIAVVSACVACEKEARSDCRAPPYDFDEHVVGPLASSRLTLLLLLQVGDEVAVMMEKKAIVK
jgi:hypothetical protein